MDKYLQRNSSYNRLCEEYKKYGSLIVAVDFDDTLYDFHKAGHSYEKLIQLVRDLKSINCFIIIWTGNQDTEFVTNYLNENNIPFDTINDEAPISKKLLGENIPRKVYANVYLDDRAGLFQVYAELSNLYEKFKKVKFYRVCNEESKQGLWYGYNGLFTGLIHKDFSFCHNNSLEMDFDSELVGWLSATPSLEDLYHWFPVEDIKKLQEHNYFIHEYETNDYKFYEKFNHFVINQENSTLTQKIVL